jgi:hypothetical protein
MITLHLTERGSGPSANPSKRAMKPGVGTGRGRDKKIDVVYHAAPRYNRDSILKYGIDPSRFTKPRSTSGNLPFVFSDLDMADYYAKDMAYRQPVEEWDIWKVDGKKYRFKPDYNLFSDDPYGGTGETDSWRANKPISSRDVKLLKTVGRASE